MGQLAETYMTSQEKMYFLRKRGKREIPWPYEFMELKDDYRL